MPKDYANGVSAEDRRAILARAAEAGMPPSQAFHLHRIIESAQARGWGSDAPSFECRQALTLPRVMHSVYGCFLDRLPPSDRSGLCFGWATHQLYGHMLDGDIKDLPGLSQAVVEYFAVGHLRDRLRGLFDLPIHPKASIPALMDLLRAWQEKRCQPQIDEFMRLSAEYEARGEDTSPLFERMDLQIGRTAIMLTYESGMIPIDKHCDQMLEGLRRGFMRYQNLEPDVAFAEAKGIAGNPDAVQWLWTELGGAAKLAYVKGGEVHISVTKVRDAFPRIIDPLRAIRDELLVRDSAEQEDADLLEAAGAPKPDEGMQRVLELLGLDELVEVPEDEAVTAVRERLRRDPDAALLCARLHVHGKLPRPRLAELAGVTVDQIRAAEKRLSSKSKTA